MTAEIQAFLIEWEREFAATSRLMGSLPPTALSWRPHPKSRTAGELVWHLVQSERLAANSYLAGKNLGEEVPAAPPTLQAMIQTYAPQHQDLSERVRKAPDEAWTRPQTGEAFLRPRLLHHAIHHRGQLSVYLRLLDAKVPPVYGPTADHPQPAA